MKPSPIILSPDDPISAGLAARDPQLGAVMRLVGRVELHPPGTPFEELVGSVVGQQLSLKAASTIWGRVIELTGTSPEGFAAATPEDLRAAGLSRAKTEYVQGIAMAVLTGGIDLDSLDRLDDEHVIAELTTLRGVGCWTAEMFLLFSLRRPDVLALDDMGVRSSAGRMAGLGRAMTREELAERGESWRPHRSVASLWLWESLAWPEQEGTPSRS